MSHASQLSYFSFYCFIFLLISSLLAIHTLLFNEVTLSISHCNKYVTCISTLLIFSSIAVFLLVSLLPLDILFWLLTRVLSMGSHCLSSLKRVIHTCCPPASVTRAYRPSSYFSFYCFISLSRSSSSWQSLLATHTLPFNVVTLTISS